MTTLKINELAFDRALENEAMDSVLGGWGLKSIGRFAKRKARQVRSAARRVSRAGRRIRSAARTLTGNKHYALSRGVIGSYSPSSLMHAYFIS